MPLRSKLLAVPALRERYMQYVRQIANDSIAWSKLGPVVEGYRDLIDPIVQTDTRKAITYDAFQTATSSEASESPQPMSLRKFSDGRSRFLTSAER